MKSRKHDGHGGQPADQVEAAAGPVISGADDEQGADHEGAEEQADPGAAAVGWILAKTPGTTSSLAMP